MVIDTLMRCLIESVTVRPLVLLSALVPIFSYLSCIYMYVTTVKNTIKNANAKRSKKKNESGGAKKRGEEEKRRERESEKESH